MLGLLLCCVGLVLTRSPIGAALAMTAVAVLFSRRRQRVVVAAALVLLVVLTAVVLLRADVAELEPLSLRLDNWRSALSLWSAAPLTGIGLGSFGQAVQSLPLTVGNRPAHAHSLPLEWSAELGVVGCGLFLMAAIAVVRLVWRLWPRRPELAVAVAIVPAHNLVDFSLYVSGVALPWAVLAGWAIAEARPEPVLERDNPGRPLVVATMACAIAIAMVHSVSVVMERAASETVDATEAAQLAGDAHGLAPWRRRALTAYAELAGRGEDLGRMSDAVQRIDRWRWLSPRSVALASLRGYLAERLGDLPTAVAEAWYCASSRPHDAEAQRNLERLVALSSGDR
jgi:hypothetical protein